MQAGGECFSSATARETYQKYGEATNCKANGKGAGWGNQVYEILSGKHNVISD